MFHLSLIHHSKTLYIFQVTCEWNLHVKHIIWNIWYIHSRSMACHKLLRIYKVHSYIRQQNEKLWLSYAFSSYLQKEKFFKSGSSCVWIAHDEPDLRKLKILSRWVVNRKSDMSQSQDMCTKLCKHLITLSPQGVRGPVSLFGIACQVFASQIFVSISLSRYIHH